MKGTILGIDNEMVIVVDHENRRRRFPLSEWKSRQLPKAGMTIDFETVGEAQAKDAYSIPTAVEDDRGSSVQPKKAGGKSGVLILVVVLVVTVLAFVILLIPEWRQMMVAHLRARAESGNPEAQFELGRCLATGKYGVERDSVEATDWFRKAAEQNYAPAQVSLGNLYSDDSGGPSLGQNNITAYKWFLLAAQQGDRQGGLMLTNCEFGMLEEDADRATQEAANFINKLGIQACSKGNWVAATADFSEAIAFEPQWSVLYDNRGMAEERGAKELTNAIKDFNISIVLTRIAPNLTSRRWFKEIGVGVSSSLTKAKVIG